VYILLFIHFQTLTITDIIFKIFGLGQMKRSKAVVALPTTENGQGQSQGLEAGLHRIGELKQG